MVWFNNVQRYGTVTLVRMIRSIESTQPFGYMVIDLEASHLRDTMGSIQLESGWALSLTDSDGVLIVSTLDAPETIGADFINRIRNQALNGFFVSKNGKNKDTLYCYYHLMDMDQYLIGMIPVALLNTESHQVAQTILTIGLTLVLISMLIAFFMTRSVTKPLSSVAASLQRVTAGDLNISVEVKSEDEIGQLSRAFNQMVLKTKELLAKATSSQLLQREAEFKALQAQINPHFLYNALETINWMAKSKNATDICHMVNALGSLMRTSISSKKEFVCVEEEMQYVKDYIYIQNMRYGEQVLSEIDVEPELLSHSIPKFIIQPIVENAITHGLEQKLSEGCVRIRGFLKKGTIRFVVSDDGVGMEKECVERILSGPAPHSNASRLGMGLRNVHDRIQLYYGEEYGLSISSVAGVGTTVQIVLPEGTCDA